MKHGVKWLSRLLVVLLLAVCLLTTAFAQGTALLEISAPTEVTVDGTVEVKVSAKVSGIVADGKLVINYDATRLEFVEAKAADAWNTAATPVLSVNSTTSGKLIVAFAGTTEAGAEDVLVIKFNAKSVGTAAISVDAENSYVSDADNTYTLEAEASVEVREAAADVDKTALKELIDDCNALTEGDYTAESWAALEEALAAAEQVYNDPEATQDEVDAAYAALKAAYDALEKKPEEPAVDKSALKELIDDSNALTEGDYTAESWAALEEALAVAEQVYNDPEATQDEVDAAYAALKAAYDALEKKDTTDPNPPVNPPANPELPVVVPGASDDLPFIDVNKVHWFYDSVKYVYKNGIMSGTGATTFSPDMNTTRGMIVTILYRMEGSPAVAKLSSFADVPANKYYAQPVAWAADNGIVTGYNDTTFGPEDLITREQMAAILFRYAKYKGMDVTARADLSRYTDNGQISAYAREAMSWANAVGLINGMTRTTLAPRAYATRAQVAAIICRFQTGGNS